MLLGVLGRKGVGKDLVSDYIIKKYNYKKLTLATPLKEACRVLFNFTDDQLYGDSKEKISPVWGTSPRIIMQYLGTDIFRKDINKILPTIGDDFWILNVISKYANERNINPGVKMVVSDVRFLNEIKRIHEVKGKVIKLVRPSISNSDTHESEKNIDAIEDYDYLVVNDGTVDELFGKIDNIIEHL